MSPRTDRVPDWLLERLAAGELPSKQADELRATLRAQGEESRLAELIASNAEILAALPADRVVREVERRAFRTTVKSRRPLFAFTMAAATCAAGLAVFIAVRDHGSGDVGGPIVDNGPVETIGIRGDHLVIHRKTSTGFELVKDGAVVRRGDTLQLSYQAEGKRFGVIASVDGRGTVTLHLPETPGPAATLEPGLRNLAHAYELDDAPGFERFVFVTSDARFDTAAVASALTRGQPYPAGSKVFTITLTKESP
jgi:hypothetical protein